MIRVRGPISRQIHFSYISIYRKQIDSDWSISLPAALSCPCMRARPVAATPESAAALSSLIKDLENIYV